MGPPEPDDTGPTPAQRPRSVVTTSRSSPMVGITPTTRPGRTCGELGEHLLLPCSTGTLAPGQLPWSPGGELDAGACAHTRRLCQRRPSSALDTRASDALPALDHPFPARPDSGNDEQAAHRPQRYVEAGALDVACPAAPMYSGSSAVRTAWMQRPRTPDACLSGHPDRTGRVDTGRLDTGRPPDQLVGQTSARRTADADRATNGVADVRTPWTATTTATAGRTAQPSLGLMTGRSFGGHTEGVRSLDTRVDSFMRAPAAAAMFVLADRLGCPVPGM
jgi:hypothetical protein